MTLEKGVRNTLRNTVTACRRLLETAAGDLLEGQLGIHRDGRVEPEAALGKLEPEVMEGRPQVLAHLEHIRASGFGPAEAVTQLIREAAFTHLNRLCAYKMLEQRKLIRESVSRGIDSPGLKFYLADHPEDERLWSTGQADEAYRHYLLWIGAQLSEEIGALFAPTDCANRLFPPQRVLDQVLALLNAEELRDVWGEEETIGWVYQYYTPKELRDVWGEEETIGWVYQYYTPKELRDKARKESQAPRNSYEMAFRNQFYTPRYVVEFLVDNTLGRTWYEMRQGRTRLTEQCRYLVRRPDEVFLNGAADRAERRGGVPVAHLLREADERSFPPYEVGRQHLDRTMQLAMSVDGYLRHPPMGDSEESGPAWLNRVRSEIESCRVFETLRTQDLLDLLFLMVREDHRTSGDGSELEDNQLFVDLANEVRRRALKSRATGLSTEEQLRLPVFVHHREPKDARSLRILDPACGSGHFLLYCFDLLLTIYEEAYEADDPGNKLRQDYPERERFLAAVPKLILEHNLHGIDIDARATQIAALALWLRAQRAYQELGLGRNDRPKIERVNVVIAEPMPGEVEMLRDVTASLEHPVIGQIVEKVFEKMKLAGEAGSLLKIEEELKGTVASAKRQWQDQLERARDKKGRELLFSREEDARLAGRSGTQLELFDVSGISDAQFFDRVEQQALAALERYAAHAENGRGFQRRLFAADAHRGFAFVDVCWQRYDVVLMNPPFGEASKPSKKYIEERYPRTKNDVYAAFVERGLEWVWPRGYVGAITSRTGFFLSSFRRWREEILLKEARPTVVADLGYGVLDTAMVETAAYVLERNG